jgi:hypothetical protein
VNLRHVGVPDAGRIFSQDDIKKLEGLNTPILAGLCLAFGEEDCCPKKATGWR